MRKSFTWHFNTYTLESASWLGLLAHSLLGHETVCHTNGRNGEIYAVSAGCSDTIASKSPSGNAHEWRIPYLTRIPQSEDSVECWNLRNPIKFEVKCAGPFLICYCFTLRTPDKKPFSIPTATE